MRWLVVVLLALGCYSPSYRDCALTCAADVCPAGLECLEGVCRLPGMTGPCAVEEPDDASTGDTADASSEPIAVGMFRMEMLAAQCKQGVRCGTWENESICLETLGNQQSVSYVPNLVASVTAGKVIYDADQARRCVDAILQQACVRNSQPLPIAPFPPACDAVLSGTLGNGATCAMSEQCKSELCSLPGCTMACCTGTCNGDIAPQHRTVNQSCTNRDRCIDSYCDGAICVALKTQGMACQHSGQCASGFVCKTTAGTLTCEPMSMTLGSCANTQDCLNLSDVCSSGKCVTGGLSGFSCPMGNECQQYHWCKTAMCAVPPTVPESCQTFPLCRSGYCAGVCQPKKENGVTCDAALTGRDCKSGYCTTTGMCESRPICI